jgi:hypothetical protein
MRRILLLVVSAVALALAVPAAASAHGGHHRHRHHHVKAHHARTEHFGASANTDPSGGPGQGPGDAGRVASFTNGVLTITLADGSTVSGQVTSDTNINCLGAGAQAHDSGDHGDQGDRGDDDQGDQGDDNGQGDDQQPQPSCGTAQLVQGAAVHEAILKLGPGGAEFKLVLLDEQP